MHTPIETLDLNSFVICELRGHIEGGKLETVAWGLYTLDKDLINSKLEMIDMYKAPVDVTLKQKVSKGMMYAADDHMVNVTIHHLWCMYTCRFPLKWFFKQKYSWRRETRPKMLSNDDDQ